MRSMLKPILIVVAIVLLLTLALRLATPSRASSGEVDTMCLASKIGLACSPD
jgi:hypothetical protein